ncbi:MAG: alginate lyase family protein [Bacteroidales bacterium]|nr:alginate lyase family protein [Bacteroidales bacterium]MCL2133013.1 alginate lyase family protein [Bacteroidales bacterium]
MKKIFCSIVFMLGTGFLLAQPFTLDMVVLASNKAKIAKQDKSIMPAFQKLIRTANKALSVKPFTVTDKASPDPSTDIHDYVTIAPYWFPNPDTPDGLPYIRKDGVRTPELANYPDKSALTNMVSAVHDLALAYYFTDEEKYALKATALIRTFFLDSETCMNPNLNYAQAIKGQNTGRGAGLIESRHFVRVIDAIGLLKSSPTWTESDQNGMVKWFTAFLDWMQSSKIGKDEMRAKNNHGVFYDMQRMSFALFTKNMEAANNVVESFKRRIELQQDDDGSFPAELGRTISLHYSTFVLKAFFGIASMAEQLNVDLWNYTSENDKSLKTAIDFIYPYITKQAEWTWQQISPFNYSSTIDLLKIMSLKYNDAKYANAISSVIGYEAALTHSSNLVLGLDME